MGETVGAARVIVRAAHAVGASGTAHAAGVSAVSSVAKISLGAVETTVAAIESVIVARHTGGRVVNPMLMTGVVGGESGRVGWIRAAVPFGVACLMSSEGAANLLELIHSHGGEGLRLVDPGSIVVSLVDRNSGMDNLWLDGFPMDDGLNGFMNW